MKLNYREWEETVPQEIKGDSLWKVEVYRLALFVTEIGWQDASKLLQDARTKALADQLYRSLGSISANIAEGYSRGTSKDRAHFYEYALGSARESRDWYYKARHALSDAASAHRLKMITQIVRLLLVMLSHKRGTILRET